MIDRDRIQDLIPLVALAAIAAALVIVAAYMRLHRPFISPLTTISTLPVYLPLVLRGQRIPDRRFGIAEHTPEEAALLSLTGADYISGQWRLPLEGDTVVFLRPTERPHWSTWKLCSWSAVHGWYDEAGCREWVHTHPSTIYIIGNELSVVGSVGDGYWVDANGYARWYHEAQALIEAEDPTAVIAPYGPVGSTTAGLLLAVWDSYQRQFDELLPADFYPIHHYCHRGDEPWWCWQKLAHWIDWVERHRGTHWQGPRDYWLTEWGLMAWDVPVPEDAALGLMTNMVAELRDNDIGISHHAWWPSCNSSWPDSCTWLVEDGKITRLGKRYFELSLAPLD